MTPPYKYITLIKTSKNRMSNLKFEDKRPNQRHRIKSQQNHATVENGVPHHCLKSVVVFFIFKLISDISEDKLIWFFLSICNSGIRKFGFVHDLNDLKIEK
jgi:hypothetical protein